MNPMKTMAAFSKLALASLLVAASAQAQQVYYVDGDRSPFGDGSSWDQAFKDLQDAFAVAASGDEIWVAQGIYKPGEPGASVLSSFALIEGVALYGGFAGHETSVDERVGDASILCGDLNNDDVMGVKGDNSYHVVTAMDTTASALLDRFTITAGSARGSQQEGGGLLVEGSGPTLVDCEFTANDALHYGGGASVVDGTATFLDCRFEDNLAGKFSSSGGGGLSVRNADVKLVGCDFLSNRIAPSGQGGGGLFVNGGVVQAWNVRFLGNDGGPGDGGAVLVANQLAPSQFANCLFSGNTTTASGGAIAAVNAATPRLANCTVAFNTAPAGLGGGVLVKQGSSLKVRNSIVWGNSDSSGSSETAQIERPGGLDLKWSTVMGWSGPLGSLGGSEVLISDPLFADAVGPDMLPGTDDDDLRLTSASPCLDVGNNNDVPADDCDFDDDGVLLEFVPIDLDLTARFVGTVDHGPYERDSVCGAPWTNLGSGLGGALGTPVLTGTGSLVGGTPTALDLTGAQPFVPYYFILGLTQLSASFKGGTLVPSPSIVSALPPIFPGAVSLAFTWPTGVPSCTDIWFQYWIQDPTGPVGFTASNGLRATTP